MVNASEEWCGFESQVIKSVTNTGSNPVLTTRFGSSPNSMPNMMRNEVIPHMGLLIDKGSIRFD